MRCPRENAPKICAFGQTYNTGGQFTRCGSLNISFGCARLPPVSECQPLRMTRERVGMATAEVLGRTAGRKLAAFWLYELERLSTLPSALRSGGDRHGAVPECAEPVPQLRLWRSHWPGRGVAPMSPAGGHRKTSRLETVLKATMPGVHGPASRRVGQTCGGLTAIPQSCVVNGRDVGLPGDLTAPVDRESDAGWCRRGCPSPASRRPASTGTRAHGRPRWWWRTRLT